MRVVRLPVAALAAVLVVGCTGDVEEPAATGTAPSTVTSPPAPTTSSAAPTGTTDPASPTEGDVAFGTGTVRVDGVEMPVSGDCDVSREFGTQPVTDLGEDVDLLLAVDNVTGGGDHDGPFAVQVRLLGRGPATEGRISSQGGAEDAEATYEGQVEVAELRDRRELEFLDVATLHLEATQQRVRGDGPATRQLVVDVTCPISRPG